MVFALKLHLSTHHNIINIPSISFKNTVLNQQAPLFKVEPIQTTSLSHLHFQSRRKSIYGYKASYVEGFETLNSNGGRGGGVDDGRKERGDGDGDGDGEGAKTSEVVRLFFRVAEFLLECDRDIVGTMVGFQGKLALLCVQVMWQLHLAMMEICYAVVMVTCVGVVFVSAVVMFLFLRFV